MNGGTVNPIDLASLGVLEDAEVDDDDGPVGLAAPSDADANADAIEHRFAQVAADGHGERLDKWLVRLAPEFSRNHLQSLIEGGHVRSGETVLSSASKKVAAGQRIEVALWPTAQSTAFRAEPMVLNIVHEDAHLLVIDKPAGLVVHPAAGHWSGTLLNGLLAHHAGAASLARAGIVHRLDKDTSGLMLVAKTLVAQTALVRAIAAREVKREYLALAHGALADGLQVIDAAIGRDPVSRVKMALVTSGKPARTDVTCIAIADLAEPASTVSASRVSASLVRRSVSRQVSAVHCRLHSGRTHQIRVHLASRGFPLLADAMYGGAPALGLNRQALHAVRLSLLHPVSGQPMVFVAPLPADLAQAWLTVTGADVEVALACRYNEAP
jgi:23S rRNA pseudouridine1911/1915/1917 synthase